MCNSLSCAHSNKKHLLLFIMLVCTFLFLIGCKSVVKYDSEGNPIPTYEVEESLNFTEVHEPYKYIFLRLYDVDYLNPLYIANLLKFGINLTEVNDVQVSHAAINFTLNDDFYGLTSGGKFQLDKEQCLDTKANKFLKKCDPMKSTQFTYAIRVSEEDFYKAKAMVEAYAQNKDIKYDVMDNFKIAHFATKRRFRTKTENRAMEDMSYPELEDKRRENPDYVETDFVCSTFCAYILKENVSYIGEWFKENNINYNYVGVSDLPYIPGVVRLFSSKFYEYDIAAQSFIEQYPEFSEYYTDRIIEEQKLEEEEIED